MKAQKREIYNKQDATQDGTADLKYELNNLEKKIDQEYNRTDLIDKGIRKITKILGQ